VLVSPFTRARNLSSVVSTSPELALNLVWAR